MSRGDKVRIANTLINQLSGLPVGRECVVEDNFDRLGLAHLLAVYDPVADKLYYLIDRNVNPAA